MLSSIHFDPALPVSERCKEIAESIAASQVTIVCGETGSGKTAQRPKILLEMGRGEERQIGHTQPRPVAARSVAARIAEEPKVELETRVIAAALSVQDPRERPLATQSAADERHAKFADERSDFLAPPLRRTRSVRLFLTRRRAAVRRG